MQEYQGQPCLVCGQVFTDTDDIVTCPECGTPYHRACWKETGHCINAPLHVSGESWQVNQKKAADAARREEKRAEEAAQAAERERGEGPRMINASLYDGVRINPDDPFVGLDPEEKLGDVTIGEVAEFVHSNRFYYLPLFRFMKRTGRKFSLNLICLLFPDFYFANRKMWLMALGSMLLNVLLEIPTILIYLTDPNYYNISLPWATMSDEMLQTAYMLSGMIWMAFKLFCCLFANYLYYRFAVRRIGSIKKSAASDPELHAQMQSAGGTSAGNIVLALVIKGALLFTIIALMLMIR